MGRLQTRASAQTKRPMASQILWEQVTPDVRAQLATRKGEWEGVTYGHDPREGRCFCKKKLTRYAVRITEQEYRQVMDMLVPIIEANGKETAIRSQVATNMRKIWRECTPVQVGLRLLVAEIAIRGCRGTMQLLTPWYSRFVCGAQKWHLSGFVPVVYAERQNVRRWCRRAALDGPVSVESSEPAAEENTKNDTKEEQEKKKE